MCLFEHSGEYRHPSPPMKEPASDGGDDGPIYRTPSMDLFRVRKASAINPGLDVCQPGDESVREQVSPDDVEGQKQVSREQARMQVQRARRPFFVFCFGFGHACLLRDPSDRAPIAHARHNLPLAADH